MMLGATLDTNLVRGVYVRVEAYYYQHVEATHALSDIASASARHDELLELLRRVRYEEEGRRRRLAKDRCSRRRSVGAAPRSVRLVRPSPLLAHQSRSHRRIAARRPHARGRYRRRRYPGR